jgi:hypothetical protein
MTKKLAGLTTSLLVLVVLLAAGCAEATPSQEESGGQGPEEVVLGPEDAFDLAVRWLNERYPDIAPPGDAGWRVEDVVTTGPGGEPIVGTSQKRIVSDDWEATVSWAVVAPQYLTYDIALNSRTLGWYWRGSVKGQGGVVTEQTAMQRATEEMARQVAEEFLRQSPTYRYDGIESTLEFKVARDTTGVRYPWILALMDPEEAGDYSWVCCFEFDSRHPGYGDRTGQDLADGMGEHGVHILVEAGEVVSAVMDGRWDMLSQRMLPDFEAACAIGEEFVRASPTFAFDGIPETLRLAGAAWYPKMMTTPEGEDLQERDWTFRFEFDSRHAGYGDRTGEALAEVVTPHRAHVNVEEGTVTSAVLDGDWDIPAQKMIETIAEDFVRNSPTFKYDGIVETLELVDSSSYSLAGVDGDVFVYHFDSRHAGYGDRTGQSLAELITPHEAVVQVQKGKVGAAVLDDVWNMLAQEMGDW